MTIDYKGLLASRFDDHMVSYSARDSVLYSLGVGFGRDPVDSDELRYVYEHFGPSTLPTYATMLVPDTLLKQSGVELRQLLHRAQTLTMHRPLPAAGRLRVTQQIVGIFDRGAGKGADIDIETSLALARDDTPVSVLLSRVIARADGGFDGPAPKPWQRHPIPARPADLSCDLTTRPDQALLFRLSGDFNPLHVDPALAREAGFSQPLLHGRCTFGIACHAILKTVCDYDFTLIQGFEARFSAPVYPGDVVTTEMWQDRNVVSFRCHVAARNSTVINNGKCALNV